VHKDSDQTWIASSMAHDASRLTIGERHYGRVAVLTLTGEMLIDDGDVAFRAHVHDLMLHGCANVVVDFGGVGHIDSSGVGMLVAKLQSVRKMGGDIRLVHLTARHQRLLTTMRVLPLFRVFEDEESAIRSFSEPTSSIH